MASLRISRISIRTNFVFVLCFSVLHMSVSSKIHTDVETFVAFGHGNSIAFIYQFIFLCFVCDALQMGRKDVRCCDFGTCRYSLG